MSALRHSLRLPGAVVRSFRWLERVVGALFVTLLAPIGWGLLIVAALIFALLVARILSGG